MSVVFEATIKNNLEDGWKIELIDTVSDKKIDCFSVDEFMQKVEEFGSEYGGRIDEVKWQSEEGILPVFVDEVRFQMAEFQRKLQKADSDG